MNKSLVIAACLGALLLAACAGRPTRCDQWGWYKACDLIEGQQALGCNDPCDPCRSPQVGQVVSREYAFPAQPCQKGDVIKVETVPAPAVAPMPMPEPTPVPEPAVVEPPPAE